MFPPPLLLRWQFESSRSLFWLVTVLVTIFLTGAKPALAVNVTTVVLPNGGECLTVGQNYTIQFSYSGADVEHVALYYRTDGQQPTHLDSSMIKHPINVPQQGTTWNWRPVSADISETGRIWVDSHEVSHASLNTWDQSDANISVRASCALPSSPPPTPSGGSGQLMSVSTPIMQTVDIIDVTTSSIRIVWTTDRYSFTKIKYGTSSESYTQEFSLDRKLGHLKHEAWLKNLVAGILYYFRVITGFNVTPTDAVSDKDESSPEYQFRTQKLPDFTPPSPIQQLFAVTGEKDVLFSWVSPPDKDFKNTILVRGKEPIFQGPENYFLDDDLVGVSDYLFFSVDEDGNQSAPVAMTITPVLGATAPTPVLNATSSLSRVGAPATEVSDGTITLRWKNPKEPHFLGIQIVRNDDALPAHPFDGNVVFRGRSDFFKDTGLTNNKRYSYGIFAFDWSDNFSPAALVVDAPSDLKPLTKKLNFGMEDEEVIILQKLLSKVPNIYRGPIDGLFNELVRKAVRLFQAEYEIVSSGDEKTTGFGLVGPRTRAKLNELVTGDSVSRPEKLDKSSDKNITHIVIKEADAYYPITINIVVGDTVRWMNNSSEPAWPASNAHPAHDIYPEFDARKKIKKNESYSFTFTKPGKWDYHDHWDARQTGTINVK